MEQNENIRKKKGGRPKKAIKKDQLLPVKCDKKERKKIETRAVLSLSMQYQYFLPSRTHLYQECWLGCIYLSPLLFLMSGIKAFLSTICHPAIR